MNITIHPSWELFLKSRQSDLERVLSLVAESPFLPEAERVFRFAQQDLYATRVVILGQDPYPQPGAATGRSFEVAGLTSWQTPFRQSSLRSIVRAIHLAKTGEDLPWDEVRARIADGRFPILPPDELWDAWERQGVLCLNAYLTVAPGEPLSHRLMWEPFARDLIQYIDTVLGEQVSWFLWGSDARRLGKFAPTGRHYESRHPMIASHGKDGFLDNPCFRETGDAIDWCGMNA